MTTYTIAHCNVILAVVPDGEDAKAAAWKEIEEHCADMIDEDSHVQFVDGLTLTNDPEEGDKVFWQGTGLGYMCDETGKHYEYAVHRESER